MFVRTMGQNRSEIDPNDHEVKALSRLDRANWCNYPAILKWFASLSAFTLSYAELSKYKEEGTFCGADAYRNMSQFPNIKYILRWTRDDVYPFNIWEEGQQTFNRSNCSMANCYVTSDKNFFGGDLTKFHAIAFNGHTMSMYNYTKTQFPRSRSPHQKYIFVNTESAANDPVCSDVFDDIFNWTVTYRLDSDIVYQYIDIMDKEGNVVGPKPNMTWVENMVEINEGYAERLQNKSKAAAWFVSKCKTKSKREQFAQILQTALKVFKLSLDIYGACGTLKCPRGQSRCGAILETDYYFYLSFENSFSEDYVTEKLLTALQHDAVPVVFGGANYSRYLPPGSYVDARQYSPTALAAYMNQLILTPSLYRKFFRWKTYYTYHKARHQNECNLCAALNNRTMFETTSVYHDFRKWWSDVNETIECHHASGRNTHAGANTAGANTRDGK